MYTGNLDFPDINEIQALQRYTSNVSGAPNTSFQAQICSYIACILWNNLLFHVRQGPNLKNFFANLKELKLGQVECLLVDFLVVNSLLDFLNSFFVYISHVGMIININI